MKKYSSLLPFLAANVFALMLFLTPANAQITIASQGKSTFTIVIAAKAPSSVQNAAVELQKDIQIATGARLPLQKDSVETASPIISLGNTIQARSAGISSEKLADEAFRIVTKNGNLYILGTDTPAGGWTKDGGVSNGTANGIYTFLEDYLDVRWLMPGDIGRNVPAKSTFTLDDIDRTTAPEFSWRRISHLWDYSDVTQLRSIIQWTERQKLGGSMSIDYDHNMWRAINDNGDFNVNTPAVRELYAAHPEWFAMNAAGQRPFPKSYYEKLETTNPQLVEWFAQRAIKTLKASNKPRTFSLSPSDGRGWSQSPESKALYDLPQPNLADSEASPGLPGMSSLVLKWYHDIAQIVSKEYPQGRLTGYIYGDYLFPPTKVQMELPDNFMPVVAAVGSSYSLYGKEYQERFTHILDSWAKVAPKNWFYYGWPSQLLRQGSDEIGSGNFPGSTAIITPAAPEILHLIFSTLHRNKLKGTYIYGVPSWSNAALANYILAKLNWDPTLDAKEVQRDWLERAYGTKAGAAMGQFYQQLDGWLGDYYRNNITGSEVDLAMLKGVYAAHYPEMEKLILQAKAQPMTEQQMERLQLIEDNLIVLQWRLRNAGFLPVNYASPLQRSDVQINDLLTKNNPAFPNFPGAITSEMGGGVSQKPLPWKVQKMDTPSDKSTFKGLGEGRFLIYAARDGDIRITTEKATQGAYFAAYQIWDQAGNKITSGILNTAQPITFAAKTGSAYTLFIQPRKAVNYQLRIENAALASGNLSGETLVLSGKPAATAVFYVPQSAPIGVLEDGGAVLIKKPFSGAAAQAVMGDAYTNARVLHSFDEDWRFSPDPQNNLLQRGVINANFDDSSWKLISPLDWWQMQGFPDYHGVAWYRIKFTAEALPKTDRARLYFGAVDGNTVVYLNGKKLFDHTLGPNFERWDRPFSGDITHDIKPGENTLVVQVTSKSKDTASGIFKGVAIVAGTRISR